MMLIIPAKASEKPGEYLKAVAIIDQPVFDTRQQELGELEDLVIKRNGRVKKALISIGGVLEMADKLISVKYKSLKFAQDKILLDVNRKQLTDKPEFDYYENGLFASYHQRLFPHGMMPGPYGPSPGRMPPGYHMRWSEEGSRAPKTGAQMHEDRYPPDDRRYFQHHGRGMYGWQGIHDPWNWAYYPARMLASVVIGQSVINKQGEDVATVEDLIIGTNGSVEKLILSYGGFLDIGDNLVGVPYRPIGFTNRGITYDITRRELEKQPRYSYE
jgi:sporulation protein YlmC with PRC-barrel domain